MIGRSVLISWLTLGGFMLLTAGPACAGQTTVLDSFDTAKHVVIVKVVSVEKPKEVSEDETTTEPAPAAQPSPDGQPVQEAEEGPALETAKVEVVKAYKGGLKAGTLLDIGQYQGEGCTFMFDETDLGQEFLLYLAADDFTDNQWWPEGCGRSRRVTEATDDLLYLNNLSTVRGKTRVSGTVSFSSESGSGVEGITIRFTGPQRSYFAKTDAHGVYELYDLPPGKYLVGAVLPKGWKIDENSWNPGEDSEVPSAQQQPKNQIVVESKRQVALDLYFQIDNTLRGKIYFPGANLLAGEWVKATSADGKNADGYYVAQIGADGSFALTNLPSGAYVVVVNEDGMLSSAMPYRTFYYPGVTDRTLATVLYIGAGQTVDGINITAPEPAPTVIISGQYLYADGTPVADRVVDFTSTNTDPTIYGDASTSTDADGRFTLRILKGLSGNLVGHFGTTTGEFEDSPELDAAIVAATPPAPTPDPNAANSPENPPPDPTPVYVDLSTEAMTLAADENVDQLVVKLPFPACKKKPEPAVASQ